MLFFVESEKHCMNKISPFPSFDTSRGIIVIKLNKQTISSESDSHWALHTLALFFFFNVRVNNIKKFVRYLYEPLKLSSEVILFFFFCYCFFFVVVVVVYFLLFFFFFSLPFFLSLFFFHQYFLKNRISFFGLYIYIYI